MREMKRSWLIEMWKIKLSSWRDSARIYARSGISLSRSLLFPALEMRRLEKPLAPRKGAREDVVLSRAGRWFSLLGRLGLRPSCLACSLTLARVLRQEGHDARLVFGVRGDNGDTEGHCWVTVDGISAVKVPRGFEEPRYR